MSDHPVVAFCCVCATEARLSTFDDEWNLQLRRFVILGEYNWVILAEGLGVYWFHFIFDGRHIQRSTKQNNPNAARQIEAAYRTKLAKAEVGIHEKQPIPCFKDAMAAFLSWSERKHSSHPRTNVRYRTSSKALLKHFRNPRLDTMTRDDVEQFKVARIEEKGIRSKRALRPATVNRELACGKAMFNFVRKAHPALLNPFAGVKMLAEENEQMRVLNYEEQQKYLSEASQPLKGALKDVATLILETGMRPEEVYRITRTNVHLNEGYLFNPCGKTKAAKRKVPLSGVAAEFSERGL